MRVLLVEDYELIARLRTVLRRHHESARLILVIEIMELDSISRTAVFDEKMHTVFSGVIALIEAQERQRLGCLPEGDRVSR